jgi:hypothetical protein
LQRIGNAHGSAEGVGDDANSKKIAKDALPNQPEMRLKKMAAATRNADLPMLVGAVCCWFAGDVICLVSVAQETRMRK